MAGGRLSGRLPVSILRGVELNDVALIMFTALVGVTWGCQALVFSALIAAYLAGLSSADLVVYPMILSIAFFGKILGYIRGYLR